MPERPKVKELVYKHEKPKEISKPETQLRQKPKAKFRDGYVLGTSDERLSYPAFERNGFTEPNSIKLRSIIKKKEDNQNNGTIIKNKNQSKIFQSKSATRSYESGNVSVVTRGIPRDGVVCSANDQTPSSGKFTTTRTSYTTYRQQNFGDSDAAKKMMPKLTAAFGKHSTAVPHKITDEFHSSNRIEGEETVKRSRTVGNEKFESIRKRFSSRDGFDRDSGRRSSEEETNGYDETAEKRPQSMPGSSLVRGDLVKALQHKFQQTTVTCSLKHNRYAKSVTDSSISTRRVEERRVTPNKLLDVSTKKRNAGLSNVLKPNVTAADDSREEMNQKVLDTSGRLSVVKILAKLQTNVKPSGATNSKLTPSSRQGWCTTGVSSEELQNVRRWQQDNAYVELRPSEAKTTSGNKYLPALLRQTGEDDETAWNPLTENLQEDRSDRLQKTTSEPWRRMSRSKPALSAKPRCNGEGRLAALYKHYPSGDSAKIPVVKLDEDTVEDTFESLFRESTKIDDMEKMELAFESLFTEAMKKSKN